MGYCCTNCLALLNSLRVQVDAHGAAPCAAGHVFLQAGGQAPGGGILVLLVVLTGRVQEAVFDLLEIGVDAAGTLRLAFLYMVQ